MAGPWELYAASAPTEDGPWSAYSKAPPQEQKSSRENVADMLARYALGGMGIKHAAEKAGTHAKGLLEGEIPTTPENVLPAASLAIGASPVRLGLGGPKPVPPRTLEDLQGAVEAAAVKPTGGVVPQAEAGAAIRTAAGAEPPTTLPTSVDDWIARAGPARSRAPSADDWMGGVSRPAGDEWISTLAKPKPTMPWGPAIAEEAPAVPGRARLIAQGRVADPHIPSHVVDMAMSGKASDYSALSYLRRTAPADDWSKLQGASIGAMGRTGELGKEVGWDAVEVIRKYKDMPEAGRSVLFGQPVTVAGRKQTAGLRPHMDSILADYEKIEKLSAGGKTAAPQPLNILSDVISAAGLSAFQAAMGRPQTLATMRQWSNIIRKIYENGKTPASIGALVVATRNLENALGEKIDIERLAQALNPIGSAQAQTRSIADINKPLPQEEEARRRIMERVR